MQLGQVGLKFWQLILCKTLYDLYLITKYPKSLETASSNWQLVTGKTEQRGYKQGSSTDVWNKFIPPLLHGRSQPTPTLFTCVWPMIPILWYILRIHTFMEYSPNLTHLCSLLSKKYFWLWFKCLTVRENIFLAAQVDELSWWTMRGMWELFLIYSLLKWYWCWEQHCPQMACKSQEFKASLL